MKKFNLATLTLMLSIICLPVYAAQVVDQGTPAKKEAVSTKPNVKSTTSHVHTNKMLHKEKMDTKSTDKNAKTEGVNKTETTH